MRFKDLELHPELIRAVNELGFMEATPIQTESIPELLSGQRDLIGLAQTGTGKTAAFGLPMIQQVDFKYHRTQGLVLCPTRELCVQIARDMNQYAKYVKKAGIVAIYGGADMDRQRRQVKSGAQIIVATPGRLLDFMKRGVIDLSGLKYVVLDEADEMLNMGFQEDIEAILEQTPTHKRTWLFSATMPSGVSAIAKKFMQVPLEVTIGKKNSGAANIAHIYFLVKEMDRYQALKRMIDFHPDIYGLVFCRTRKETQEVAEMLIKDGYNAEALHGDLSQQVRDQVMRRFKEKSLQVLIATDVAARGIDVQDISHVINYRLPDETDIYTHRSGRTGRAGKSGTAVSIINTREKDKIAKIENKSGIKFTYMQVPDGSAICENQLFMMMNKLSMVEVAHNDIEKFLPPVYELLENMTKEELIQKFVSLEFNRFLTYYKDAGDINAVKRDKKANAPQPRPEKHPREKSRGSKRPSSGTRRFFMNAGRLDNIDKGAVIRNVCDRAGIRASKIGKVQILREFSFFEIEAGIAEKVLKAMKGFKIDGRIMHIQFADNTVPPKKEKPRKRSLV